MTHAGEGFWKNISGYGPVKGLYADPQNQTAAFLGLPKQNGKDTIASVRKIQHIGIANVDEQQLLVARRMTRIAAVQNAYNVLRRGSDRMIELCERDHIAFIPFAPLGMRGSDGIKPGDSRVTELQAVATRRGVSLAQLVLAWQLARSRVIIPIPGTTRIDHLEEDVAAARLHLSRSEMQQID